MERFYYLPTVIQRDGSKTKKAFLSLYCAHRVVAVPWGGGGLLKAIPPHTPLCLHTLLELVLALETDLYLLQDS